MSKRKSEKFIEDLDSVETQPKWVSSFRESYYRNNLLPFLIVYQASAIADDTSSSLYGDKSAAIAIATANLQKSGYLLESTNMLSRRGEIHEIAVLSRLGKNKAKSYIARFENF
jgi:hypothetical protein